MATERVHQSSVDTSWEASVSYRQFVLGTLEFVATNFQRTRLNYTFPRDTKQDLSRCLANLHASDAVIVLILALGWTLLRHLCSEYVFKVGNQNTICRSPRSCV